MIDETTPREVLEAYEQFKQSLPPMPPKDYEQAMRKYCEENGT